MTYYVNMCNVPFVLTVTSYPTPHPVIIGDDVFPKNVGHDNTFQKRGVPALSKVTQTGYSVKSPLMYLTFLTWDHIIT